MSKSMNKIINNVVKINWFEEDLHKFYGDNNKGFIFGIEIEDIFGDYDCQWFKTEKERNKELKEWEEK